MNRYKVCVYAIAKNEGQFVDRWVDCVGEADLIIVTDTGSTDNTMQKLRDRGVTVYSYPMEHFRFDEARNECLKHVPEDVDICVAPDLDDVIEPGWRARLEESWTPQTKQGTYLYNWSFNPDGTPAVQYTHNRIHARHDFKWIYPTHEILQYTGTEPHIHSFIPGMAYNHYPDRSKYRGFNLELLELAVKDYPNNSRNYHYLGREYMFYGMWDKCINTLKRYLALPDATWAEERAASMRFIGKAYYGKGDRQEARNWFHRAVAESPYARESYVELALMADQDKDWPACFNYANEALKIKSKTLGYINEAFAWDWTPYDLAALGCYNLGLYGKAVEFSRHALDFAPEDERLKKNHQYYIKAVGGEAD